MSSVAATSDFPSRAWSVYGDPGDDFTEVYVVAGSGETLYVGGAFRRIARSTGPLLAISEETGQLNSTWPLIIGEEVDAVESDGEGGWYVGGSFSAIGGLRCSNLAHVLADGSVDPTFCPMPDEEVDVLELAGSRLYVLGWFSHVGTVGRNGIAALDASGGSVLGWYPEVSGFEPFALGGAISVSGDTVYVGGDFSRIGGVARRSIAAVDALTARVLDWNPGKHARISSDFGVQQIEAVDGRVYVYGNFTRIGGKKRCDVAALNVVTGRALPWNPNANCKATIWSMDVQRAIVYLGLGRDSRSIGGKTRFGAAAVSAAGVVLPWAPRGPEGGTTTICAAGRTVYLGGEEGDPLVVVDAVSGSNSFVELPQPDWSGFSWVSAIGVADGSLIVGGTFSSVDAVPRRNLAAIDLTSGEVTAWDPGANGEVEGIAVEGSRVYVGGAFTAVGGAERRFVAAIDAGTGAVVPWSGDATADGISVDAMQVEGSRIYVGGTFTVMGGKPRNHLAALSTATGLATDWNPDVGGHGRNTSINDLRVDGQTVYAGGDFGTMGTADRRDLAAIDADTGEALPWNPSPDDQVWAVLPLPSSVIVGGEFLSIGGAMHGRIARVNPDGSAATWTPKLTPVPADDPEVDDVWVDGTRSPRAHALCLGSVRDV